MRLCLWISKMKTGKAVRRVGRDSEFANSANLSTRILRFGNLEAGRLRKILPIKLRDTNAVEKIPKGSPTNGLVTVRSSFCKTCGMVAQTKCQCRGEDILWSNRSAMCIGVWDWKWHSKSPNSGHYIHKSTILILPPEVWALVKNSYKEFRDASTPLGW